MASSDPGSDVDVDVDVDGDVDGTGDLDSGFQPEGARISTTVSQQGHARVNGKFQLQRETLASSHPRVFFFFVLIVPQLRIASCSGAIVKQPTLELYISFIAKFVNFLEEKYHGNLVYGNPRK